MNKLIPIVLSTDEKYILQTRVAMESIMQNRKSQYKIIFYVITNRDFSNQNVQVLMNVVRYNSNCELQFICVENDFKGVKLTLPNVNTEATFYRLGLAKYLEKYDKCIYLDSDIIVASDITPLIEVPIENYYIAGVKAPAYVRVGKHNENYALKIGLPSMEQYINAGVLIFNLRKIREEGITEKFLQYVNKPYPSQDQDIINIVCYNKIFFLPFKYNVMTKYSNWNEYRGIFTDDEVNEAWTHPVIIHYADHVKPWKVLNSKWAEKWWEIFVIIKDIDFILGLYGKSLFAGIRDYQDQNVNGCFKEYMIFFIEYIKKYDLIYIYGNGIWGNRIKEYLTNNDVRISGFIKTKLELSDKKHQNVFTPDDIKRYKDQALIIIGTSEQYQFEIQQTLKEDGFKNILSMNKFRLDAIRREL